jgi:hypothetical protein
LFRSKFKFFAVTFGSSFCSVTIGYLRFAVEWKNPLVDEYRSKKFVACVLIIMAMLAHFFYIMNLVTTNILTNIVAKNFYGDQLDRFYVYFSHYFKGGFDFWTLFFPSFVLLSFYAFQIVFIFVKNIREMGMLNTMRLLVKYPTLFFFSILTNLMFFHDNAEDSPRCLVEIVEVEQSATNFYQTPKEETSLNETSPTGTLAIPYLESHSMAELNDENDPKDADIIPSFPTPTECFDIEIAESFDDKFVNRIKFSKEDSKKSFKVWMILTLILRAIDISLQAVRGHFFVHHEIFKVTCLFVYFVAFLYFTCTENNPDEETQIQDNDLEDLDSATLEGHEEEEAEGSSITVGTHSRQTDSPASFCYPLYILPVQSSSKFFINRKLTKHSVDSILIGQNALISTMRLDTLVGGITEGAVAIQ